MEITELREAVREWGSGRIQRLLELLGYERIGLVVPDPELPDFGLDEGAVLRLEVAARYDSYQVFRIRLPDLDGPQVTHAARALYRRNPARRALLFFEAPGRGPWIVASWGLGPGPFRLRRLWLDPGAPGAFELDTLASLAARPGQSSVDLAVEHARALDRETLTRSFFRDFRRHRVELAGRLQGVPQTAQVDRLELSLILMSRLLFLYFLQRKGWLARDPAYLRRLCRQALEEGVPVYRQRLKPLFFEALNRPRARRGTRARELGALPYLNGGLFERDRLERLYPRLDVPDDWFPFVFDQLFDRYQFTLREDRTADQQVAVDPEMLGKVFEGLMVAPAREASGTFYTPVTLVDRIVEAALIAHLSRDPVPTRAQLLDLLAGNPTPRLSDAVRSSLAARVRGLRILDPAVGSGAFLLAGLHQIEALRAALGEAPHSGLERFRLRREILEHNLYGVDVNATAVRLCELRLWLALIVDLEVTALEEVPPLPNLDLKIRQGDSLVDPVDFVLRLTDLEDRNLTALWRREVGRLDRRRARYFHAAGSQKRRAARALREAERDLALRFLERLARQLDARIRDLVSVRDGPDLFGQRSGLSDRQARVLSGLQTRRRDIDDLLTRIHEAEGLPFFSFAIHFADAVHPQRGFDIAVGNPPWVRPHRWAGPGRAQLKERYAVLRDPGWRRGAGLAGAGHGFATQLDLSALFLERSLELLREGGVLGFLMPAKIVRALYGGGLRRYVHGTTRILCVEDASLAATRFFDATTYPAILLLESGRAETDHQVEILLHTREPDPLVFRLPQRGLSLLSGEPASPWCLAPPAVREILAGILTSGDPLGARTQRRPRRGIVTGANTVFLARVTGSPEDDGTVPIEVATGPIRIETECLRPALRGADIAAWGYRIDRALIWTHDANGDPRSSLPDRARAYLLRHQARLRRRRDLKSAAPLWSLFRVAPEKWASRVVWRDIARAPAAAVVPQSVPFLDCRAPIISLNTVYQVATGDEDEAHFLAAILNSLIARVYLRSIAERASGGYFRFLGWTVGLLPLPDRPDPRLREACIGLSRRAHRGGALDGPGQGRLDRTVGRLYGIAGEQLQTLATFDQRLGDDRE